MSMSAIGARAAGLLRSEGAGAPADRSSAPERFRRRPTPLVRVCAACGGFAVLFCTAMLVALHLLPATSRLNPLSQPLSKYALGSDGGIFDAAVLVLAVGVLALLAALLIDRRGRWPTVTALGSCATGLVVLVACPDISAGGGLTAVGWTHWTASMVAFGVMPLVPVRMWRRHRGLVGCATLPRLSGSIGVLCYSWFALLIGGNIVAFTTGVPLWVVGGLIERVLATTELAAAFLVAAWTWRGCPCVHRHFGSDLWSPLARRAAELAAGGIPPGGMPRAA